jgi:hypothetical protein
MPNYSLKARVLRIKQTNGLDFSTALPTSPSPLPILPPRPFFMKFRGPQALSNRPRKTMVRATAAKPRCALPAKASVRIQFRLGDERPMGTNLNATASVTTICGRPYFIDEH